MWRWRTVADNQTLPYFFSQHIFPSIIESSNQHPRGCNSSEGDWLREFCYRLTVTLHTRKCWMSPGGPEPAGDHFHRSVPYSSPPLGHSSQPTLARPCRRPPNRHMPACRHVPGGHACACWPLPDRHRLAGAVTVSCQLGSAPPLKRCQQG
jgi:hypothetical protein